MIYFITLFLSLFSSIYSQCSSNRTCLEVYMYDFFGDGTRDIFFGDCWILVIVLTSQICVKIITDAIIIGVIYCRISRPNKRAATIVFSCNAIIKRIQNRLYFTFRVCELRKHQLVEAHIRCYAIRHERDCETGIIIYYYYFIN